MKKNILYLIIIGLTLSACGGSAGIDPPRGENSQARATAFKRLSGDMKIIGDIVQGNEPYRADQFQQDIDMLVKDSAEPFKHFQQDKNGLNGQARPNIWTDPKGFEQAKHNFQIAVEQLNTATKTQDLSKIKPAFGQVANSCKACHKSFKNK